MRAKTYAYIGNWRSDEKLDHGIAVCEYDEAKGTLSVKQRILTSFTIGCLYIDKKRNVLYCTDEVPDLEGLRGGGGGRLAACAIDPDSGTLRLINILPSYGARPSYLAMDERGDYLLVSNYGSKDVSVTRTVKDAFGRYHIAVDHDESSVALFPLGENGRIGEPVDILKLYGEGPKPFQMSAHAHCITRAPGSNLFAVCDKGGDQVHILRLDYENRRLAHYAGSPWKRGVGTAPRYGLFHPSRPYLFVNKEAKTVVSSFRYDEKGELEHICTVSMLPEGAVAPDKIIQTDICLDHEGKYLYILSRHFNAVSVLEVDQETGMLSFKQFADAGCKAPRACALSPDGRFLLVSGHESGRVLSYPIGENGRLGKPVFELVQPTPGFITFHCT